MEIWISQWMKKMNSVLGKFQIHEITMTIPSGFSSPDPFLETIRDHPSLAREYRLDR